MILKIRNVSIGCFLFKNSDCSLISAKNLSQNTQRGIDQTHPRKNTLEICFLTTCFDVNCSCVDKATSLSSTRDTNTILKTSDTSLNCMILNTRINESRNEQEKQNIITQFKQTEGVKDDNVSLPNATMQKRGMLGRFHNWMSCNRIVVCKHVLTKVKVK